MAAGVKFIRMAALLNRGYAKLRLTMRTITPIRFAREGRVERQFSNNLHSYAMRQGSDEDVRPRRHG